MTSLKKLQELKIIGISDGEVAMPVFYNKNIFIIINSINF